MPRLTDRQIWIQHRIAYWEQKVNILRQALDDAEWNQLPCSHIRTQFKIALNTLQKAKLEY